MGRSTRTRTAKEAKEAKSAPAWRGPWLVHFFKRRSEDDPSEAVPGERFLSDCPPSVRAKRIAIVRAVADAPPPMFAGGGKWEAMHDDMKGFYEARADGEDREHFRLFCVLDRHGADVGLRGPSLVIITGMRKAFRTTFTERDYRSVRALGDEFLSKNPRPVA